MSEPQPYIRETAATPLRRLWHYGTKFRKRVLLATLCTTINKAADVFPELLIGAAVDVIVRGSASFVAGVLPDATRYQQLLVLAGINFIVWIIESASQYASQLIWRNLAQSVEHDLRVDTYRHLQQLDVAWFEDTTSGGLLSILNDDVNQLERFLDVGAPAFIALFWNVTLIGAVFVATSWQLALLAFAPIPIIAVGSLGYQRRLRPYYDRVRERVGDVSSTIAGNLGGMMTIKAFAAEEREAERVRTQSDAYRIANRDAIRYSSAFVPLIRMAILAGFTATLLIGGSKVLNGTLAVGLYSVLVFMTQRLLWPLTRIGETLDLYQRAMASTRRIFGVLDADKEMVPGVLDLSDRPKGHLNLAGVRFGYNEGSDVLSHIDIDVPAGETHAVVGATGAGKSTLVRLLLRFHDPREGVVSLDGVDLRELSYQSLRGSIGFVSQDVFLFSGTVRDNIAYGRPGATDAEIRHAAELAEAHEFVIGLADGYDSVVGERGVKLSGGQRQRIAIARAVLRDPAVLLLDEATSAVDNETEAAIQRSLEHVGEGRTVLMIAHRLSTVRKADRIWVLEADPGSRTADPGSRVGRVAEAGTHDELVAGGGLYAALWRVQTGANA